MNKRIYSFAVFVLCLLAFAATAIAQVDRATLNGTVTDASGAVVQNVKIELDSPATGLHRETATGSKGTYQVPALPIGTFWTTAPEPSVTVPFSVARSTWATAVATKANRQRTSTAKEKIRLFMALLIAAQ